MPSRRIHSLHHNIGFQDPMIGGKNVSFHRAHRSKKGRKPTDSLQNPNYFARLRKKSDEFIEKEEKTCTFDIDNIEL